jgi:hypothetical protein
MGIDSLPGALESVFPKIIAKAEELGKLIGNTISDTVNGDLTRFFMIGSLIGEMVAQGIKIGIEQGLTGIGQYITRQITHGTTFEEMAGLLDKAGIDTDVGDSSVRAAKKKKEEDEKARKDLFKIRMDDFLSDIKTRYKDAIELPTALPQKSGAHPNMPGVSYAPAGHPSQMVDEKGHRIMFDIKRGIDALNQKLAPQP